MYADGDVSEEESEALRIVLGLIQTDPTPHPLAALAALVPRRSKRNHRRPMSRKERFQDREYRATYAESFLDTTIATQIRVLREQRGWTQGQLADYAGMKQSRISALEDANYSGWGVKTLTRLARAFDVPLSVTFGSFGRLLVEIDQFNRKTLERPEFKDDPAFVPTTGYQQHGTIERRNARRDVALETQGDDELLDALTGARAALEAVQDDPDVTPEEGIAEALTELTKADLLRVAELKKVRALVPPQEQKCLSCQCKLQGDGECPTCIAAEMFQHQVRASQAEAHLAAIRAQLKQIDPLVQEIAHEAWSWPHGGVQFTMLQRWADTLAALGIPEELQRWKHNR